MDFWQIPIPPVSLRISDQLTSDRTELISDQNLVPPRCTVPNRTGSVIWSGQFIPGFSWGFQKISCLKIRFKYFKCSSNGTDCVETKLRYNFDDFGDFELRREKRAIWTPWGKREPICRLDCTCDPDVSSNIDQASAIKQKTDQKQKVTVEQAFGIGSVLAVIGMTHS